MPYLPYMNKHQLLIFFAKPRCSSPALNPLATHLYMTVDWQTEGRSAAKKPPSCDSALLALPFSRLTIERRWTGASCRVIDWTLNHGGWILE